MIDFIDGMREVYKLADRPPVLRDGGFVGKAYKAIRLLGDCVNVVMSRTMYLDTEIANLKARVEAIEDLAANPMVTITAGELSRETKDKIDALKGYICAPAIVDVDQARDIPGGVKLNGEPFEALAMDENDNGAEATPPTI